MIMVARKRIPTKKVEQVKNLAVYRFSKGDV
jgi:hypothetical protein